MFDGILFNFLYSLEKEKNSFPWEVYLVLYSIITCYDNLLSCCFTTFCNFLVLLCIIRQKGRAAHKACYVHIGILYFQPTKWRIKGSVEMSRSELYPMNKTWNMMHLSCIWSEEEVDIKVISDITHFCSLLFLNLKNYWNLFDNVMGFSCFNSCYIFINFIRQKIKRIG